MPDASPFAALKRYSVTTTSPKSALLAVSRSIEARALTVQGPAHLWVCLQDRRFDVGRTRLLHDRLAARGMEVDVYGRDVRGTTDRVSGVRAHDISEFSPLAHEWTVLLLGGRTALGMAAREINPSRNQAVADGDRRFEWLLIADPDDVRFAAAALPEDPFVPGSSYA